jgi:hypothetical protein
MKSFHAGGCSPRATSGFGEPASDADRARTLLARARGAAGAVHVRLGEGRRVVVDHRGHARHVHAARQRIGRHQHARGTALRRRSGVGAGAGSGGLDGWVAARAG